MENLLLSAVLMFLGVCGHILKTIAEIRRTEGRGAFHLKDYLIQYPYQTAALLFACIGSFALMYEAGQLNMTASFLAGWTANSAAGAFGDRVRKLQ